MARRREIFKWICWALLALTVMLAQAQIMPLLRIFGAHPNLMPAFVALLALFEGKTAGAATGFFLGLLCDALLFRSGSYCAVAFLALGFLCGLAVDIYFRRNLLTALGWAAACLFVFEFFYFFFFLLMSGRAGLGAFFTVFPAELLGTLLIVPILYLPARQLHRAWEPNVE